MTPNRRRGDRLTCLGVGRKTTHTMPAPPDGLLLKDGRFNSQIEQTAHWVDQTGRMARRNGVRAVAVVKSGAMYQDIFETVGQVARLANRPFYFVLSPDLSIDKHTMPDVASRGRSANGSTCSRPLPPRHWRYSVERRRH